MWGAFNFAQKNLTDAGYNASIADPLNANWIRAHHGSKSVTIGNITDAYNKAAHGNGFNEEFVYSDAAIKLIDTYADLTDELHTDLHECLGHGSGKLLPGVDPQRGVC